MLGKIMKYDIKFGKVPFLLMAGVMISLGLFSRIFGEALFNQIFNTVGMSLILVVVFTAISAACFVVVFQNFNRNLFSAEGYLTLTLPVKRYKLMLSKLLTTLLWFNMVVAALIVMIFIIETPEISGTVFDLTTVYAVLIWLTYNLILTNCVLFLYMSTALAHVSAAGRRPGWIFGGAALAAAITLEVLAFITAQKLQFMSGWILWFYRTSPESASWSVRLTGNINPYVQGTNYSSMSLDLRLFVIFGLFSAAAWFVTLYCLKKRVDLP